MLGQANYQVDDRIKAFYFFDEVMDEYPESQLFYPALEKQFQIADEFLRGHKRRFLGLPIIPVDDEAVEMLYRIRRRLPGSPLAEKALLRTADYYYASRDYDLAFDAYGYYIKSYPRSPKVAQAMLRQAFASLAQFRGIRFDPTPLIDARVKLLDVIAAYPNLAQEESLESLVGEVDQTLANKLLETADYYRRTHNLAGAGFIYHYVTQTYPESTQAADAKKALARLPNQRSINPR